VLTLPDQSDASPTRRCAIFWLPWVISPRKSAPQQRDSTRRLTA